jgi:hypothetical protein
MARMMAKAKTSRINLTTAPVAAIDVSAYGRDLNDWPRSWMGLDKDLHPAKHC